MKELIKVYIASPYTKGDVAVNVRRSIDMYDFLMDNGFIPFCPLLTHFIHMIHPHEYKEWLKQDAEWVKACDCVLRLDGESSGADGEVNLAEKNGIPVFHSTEHLFDFYKIK